MPRKVDRLDRIEQLLERSFEGIGRLENSLDRTIEKLDRSIERLDGTDEKLDRTAEKLDRVAEKLDHVAEQVSKNTEQLARHSEQLAKHSDQIDEIHELQKVAFQWMNRESTEEAVPERRREFRLNKVLGAVLGTGEETFRGRIFVINLSRTGLKATHQTPVPDEGEQALQLFLTAKDTPLEIQVKVAWQKELAVSGMFELGFHFLTMSEADQQRLDTFILTESKREESKPLDLSSPWKFGKPG